MSSRTVIAIGHGAYQGANRPATAHSKAQAVRILRLRGIGRDAARKVVCDVCKRTHGYATIRSDDLNVVEVEHITERATTEGWPCLNYPRAMKLRYGEMA